MWKDTLRKAPMPLDTRSSRDEQHRQAIIDYEKTVIEPAFTKYVQGLQSGEKRPLKIFLTYDKREDELVNNTFRIGSVSISKLGGNPMFIVNVIGKIYKEEGYQLEQVQEYTDGTMLTIKQS